MESESQMGPARYRTYMIFGLVVAVIAIVAGIAALLLGGGPVFGWVLIVAGVIAALAALLQLRRA